MLTNQEGFKIGKFLKIQFSFVTKLANLIMEIMTVLDEVVIFLVENFLKITRLVSLVAQAVVETMIDIHQNC